MVSNLLDQETSKWKDSYRERVLCPFVYHWEAFCETNKFAHLRLGSDQNNIFNALQIAASENLTSPYMNMLVSLSSFIRVRKLAVRVYPHFEKALEVIESGEFTQLAPSILNGCGGVQQDLGELDAARKHYKKAITICNDTNDHHEQLVYAHSALGGLYTELGNYNEARTELEKALSIADQIEPNKLHPETFGTIFLNLGAVNGYEGLYEDAERLFEKAIATTDYGSSTYVSGLQSLGVLRSMQGDYTSSIKYCEEGLKLAYVTGEMNRVPGLLSALGVAKINAGRTKEAKENLTESLRFSEQQGDQATAAHTLAQLGGLVLSMGERDEARKQLNKGISIARSAGLTQSLVILIGNLAELHIEEQNFHSAQMCLTEAIDLAESIGFMYVLVALHRISGRSYLLQNEWELAFAHYQKGESLAMENNLQSLRGECIVGKAKALEGQKHLIKARDVGRIGVAILKDIGHRDYEASNEWLVQLEKGLLN